MPARQAYVTLGQNYHSNTDLIRTLILFYDIPLIIFLNIVAGILRLLIC